MVDKYKIAEEFLDYVKESDYYYESLPDDIKSAFFDNVAYNLQSQMLHILLKQLLGQQDYDDLCYFAYETVTLIEVDDQTFTNIQDYWEYLDAKTQA